MAKFGNDTFNIDFQGLDEFLESLANAGDDLHRQIEIWFEALGFEFLELVVDEIIKREVVNTRLLLNSFHPGDRENTFSYSARNFTLVVGTNVEYASFVNDGHWTNPKGVQRRFVPGIWKGDNFEYRKGSSQGMILKQQYIQGAHYWEGALRVFERIFPAALENKLQEWLNEI